MLTPATGTHRLAALAQAFVTAGLESASQAGRPAEQPATVLNPSGETARGKSKSEVNGLSRTTR